MHKLTKIIIKYCVQVVVYMSFFSASLFLPAKRLNWVAGWVYIAINVLSMLSILLILVLKNPGLLEERENIKGKRDLDRILAGIMTFFGPIILCIVAGFNFRYQWLPRIPFFLQVIGFILAILGCILAAWAVASNKFFYGFFRIAKEMGHSVSANGAYRVVRHPGYLGAVLINLATPLILDAIYAFIPAALIILAGFMRTAIEDKALQESLEGYKSYAQKVRYRLIPFIW